MMPSQCGYALTTDDPSCRDWCVAPRHDMPLLQPLHAAHWFRCQTGGDGNCAFYCMQLWTANMRRLFTQLKWDPRPLACLPTTAADWRTECVRLLESWSDIIEHDSTWMHGALGFPGTLDTAGPADKQDTVHAPPTVHQFLHHQNFGLALDGVWATSLVSMLAATVLDTNGIHQMTGAVPAGQPPLPSMHAAESVHVYTVCCANSGKPESPGLVQRRHAALLSDRRLLDILRAHLRLGTNDRPGNLPTLRDGVLSLQMPQLTAVCARYGTHNALFKRIVKTAMDSDPTAPGFHNTARGLKPWDLVVVNFPKLQHWELCLPHAITAYQCTSHAHALKQELEARQRRFGVPNERSLRPVTR